MAPGDAADGLPRYGGFSRFELELEFVQCLANPTYLGFLASQKMFDKPDFVAYLGYLQYFREPKYSKFLHHPGPTLRALELLQQERFRTEIASLALMNYVTMEGLKNAIPADSED